jgi:hypothetical protein
MRAKVDADGHQNAIAQNQNLTTLLEQAREDHPLRSQEGLQGTAWDPKANLAD